MRRIVLILKNDLKRRLKAPVSILVLLMIPIIMTAIMGMVFGPSNSGEKGFPAIDVLLVNKDQGIASQILSGAFDSEEMKNIFKTSRVEEAEGKRLIGKGKASALVIIPEDFTAQILKAKDVQIQVIKNPSEQFLPEIVEEFMKTMGIAVSGLVQVFEPELKIIDANRNLELEKVTVQDMVPFLEQAREKIIALKKNLDPVLIQVKQVVLDKNRKTVDEDTNKDNQNTMMGNIFSQLLPGLLIFFLLFIIEIFMRDILTEREDGKLKRILFSPASSLEFILARIISGWIMGIVVAFIMVLFGVLVFNIHWGNYLYLLIFVIVTCFWIAGFFALLNGFFKNKNQAGAWTSPIILVFSAFGGSILPVNQLPESVRWVSHVTLNQWFIKGVMEVMDSGFPVLPFFVVGITGLILFISATFSLRKRVTV